MWEHFARKGKDSATCELCHKEFDYHGATTNLKEHLRRIHKEVFSEDTSSTQSQSKITQAGTKLIENFGDLSSSRVCPAERARTITEALADWLTDSMRPLTIVEDKRFKQMMRLVEPGYSVPSRTHMMSVIKARFHKARGELSNILAEAKCLAVTTDAWTSKAVESYQTCTAHFIDGQ